MGSRGNRHNVLPGKELTVACRCNYRPPAYTLRMKLDSATSGLVRSRLQKGSQIPFLSNQNLASHRKTVEKSSRFQVSSERSAMPACKSTATYAILIGLLMSEAHAAEIAVELLSPTAPFLPQVETPFCWTPTVAAHQPFRTDLRSYDNFQPHIRLTQAAEADVSGVLFLWPSDAQPQGGAPGPDEPVGQRPTGFYRGLLHGRTRHVATGNGLHRLLG